MRSLKSVTAAWKMALAGCVGLGAITAALTWRLVAVGSVGLAAATAAAGDVAGTWHFAGSAQLADNPDFVNVKKIVTMEASRQFRDFAVDRFSRWMGKSVFNAPETGNTATLSPLVDDLLSCESVCAVGGNAKDKADFVVAVKLDDTRAKAWEDALAKLAGTAGADLKAQGFSGIQWNLPGGDSVWAIPAKGWLVAGRGNSLGGTQSQYLSAITQTGRPAPALNPSWLEADLDWTQLSRWFPDAPNLLAPARTKVVLTAHDHSLFVNADITYPKAVDWKSSDWMPPTNIIRDPLISFTAGQDVAAYMSPTEPLSKVSDNPLAGQFYVWGVGGDMPSLTYGIWPVPDAQDALHRLSTEAAAAFNPALAEKHEGQFRWQPERNTLVWGPFGPMASPTIQAAPDTNGQYLLASLFPLLARGRPAPDDLWKQILGHTNMVYYDWEDTGSRLVPWQVLSVVLPILPRGRPSEATGNPNDSASKPPMATNGLGNSRQAPAPMVVEENWLNGIRPMLFHGETITAVTRTSPTELKLVRQSPFLLTSIELVLASHWMTGAESVAIDVGLLPPAAKRIGGSIPPPKSP